MKLFSNVQTSRLHNGLTVITDNLPDSRILFAQTVICAGGVHNRPDRLGTAHFLEHMWMYGNPDFPRDAFLDFQLDTGLINNFNFVTDQERTLAYCSGTPTKMIDWMEKTGDMIGMIDFSREDVERERGAIHQEMQGKLAERWFQQYRTDFLGMYGGQQLALESGGIPEHLVIISYEDLMAFYHEQYTGSNMAVIVSGPMEHDDAVDYASRKFGHLPEGSRNPRLDVQFRPIDVRLDESEKLGAATAVNLRYDTGSLRKNRLGELAILRSYIGDELLHELRGNRGIVYGAGAGMNAVGSKGQYLSIGAELAPEKMSEFFDALKQVIGDTIPNINRDFERHKMRAMAVETEAVAHSYEWAISRGAYLREKFHDQDPVIEPLERLEAVAKSVTRESVEETYSSIFGGKTPSMAYRGDTTIPLPTGAEVAEFLGFSNKKTANTLGRKPAGP